MIKLIIFDMDGVLVDAKELHYEALNEALGSFRIPLEEHLSTYDGLPTKKKLQMLTERKGLPVESHMGIYKEKQNITLRRINDFEPDRRLMKLLGELKKKYILCVASNSIRETVKMMLLKKGLIEFFDFFLSNEDVKHPKPHPEMYMQCMVKAGISPAETLIVEDSHIGRKGAIESGAHLCPVRDVKDLTIEKIGEYTNKEKTKFKWDSGPLNILIPMAGAGSRFTQAGYTFPKPLIEVNGKPMIQVVVDNLNLEGNYIYIVQKAHYDKYNLQTMLNLITPGCTIVQADGMTEGAACTTLLAQEFIDNTTPLLICNSDQFLEWESSEFMYSMQDADAGIVTFKSTHPKWSFAKLNSEGFVTQVAEKDPISDNATAGIYYWRQGRDYVFYAHEMINKDIKTNNEFYVCPVFNEALLDKKRVKTFNINRMWGLGTPEDLGAFLHGNL